MAHDLARVHYIVLGVGRCGTSTVCRVLHERLNVCFGHSEIIGKRDRHGETVYEDTSLKERLRQVTRVHAHSFAWFRAHALLHHASAACSRKRGLKLLDLALVQAQDIASLDPECVIICTRPRASNIRSWMRYNPRMSERACERWVDERAGKITQISLELAKQAPAIKQVTLAFDPEWEETPDAHVLAHVLACVQQAQAQGSELARDPVIVYHVSAGVARARYGQLGGCGHVIEYPTGEEVFTHAHARADVQRLIDLKWRLDWSRLQDKCAHARVTS